MANADIAVREGHMSKRPRWQLHLLTLAAVASLGPLCAGAEEPAATPSGVAPDAFAVRFETTKGVFVVEAYRDWAPHAVDRFFALVQEGYFDGNVFYWVKATHHVEFGLHSDPRRTDAWSERPSPIDPPLRRIQAGDIHMYPDYHGEVLPTQFGIQTGLDATAASRSGAAPFGRVVGEGTGATLPAKGGLFESLDDTHMRKPRKIWKIRRNLRMEGEAKIRRKYPDLDSIVRATLLDRTVTLPVQEPADRGGAPADLPEGAALVRVYRPGRGHQKFSLRVDGERRAVLKAGTFFETTLPAGRHDFSAKVKFKMFATGLVDKAMAGKETFSIDLRPGVVHHLRAVAGGFEGRSLFLTHVASDFAASENHGLEPAKQVTGED